MFYIIYLHVNQSVDSILITPVNVQIRNDTWDWPFTLITPSSNTLWWTITPQKSIFAIFIAATLTYM